MQMWLIPMRAAVRASAAIPLQTAPIPNEPTLRFVLLRPMLLNFQISETAKTLCSCPRYFTKQDLDTRR